MNNEINFEIMVKRIIRYVFFDIINFCKKRNIKLNIKDINFENKLLFIKFNRMNYNILYFNNESNIYYINDIFISLLLDKNENCVQHFIITDYHFEIYYKYLENLKNKYLLLR